MEEGFVKEGECGQSSGGRKPTPLEINYGARLSIGVKIVHDRIEAVLTDLSTAPIATYAIELSDLVPEKVANATREAVEHLVPDERLRAAKLIGIGLAMPGLIDIEHGICLITQPMIDKLA